MESKLAIQPKAKVSKEHENFGGYDEFGKVYTNMKQFWVKELKGDKENNWYKKSVKYWNEQATTIDGVLGGYGIVHENDSVTSVKMIKDSAQFISGYDQALDCGAGIGRITRKVLLPLFKNCDLLEPAEAQLQ